METQADVLTQQDAGPEGTRYELAYWLDGTLSPEQKQTAKESLASLIRDAGGTIEDEKEPEPKELTYPIRKQTRGFFGTLRFTLPSSEVADVERSLRLNTSLLRFLIVKREMRAKAKEVPAGLPWRGQEGARSIRPDTARPEAPEQPPRPQKPEVSSEEIDKKLEELLG